ncbi:hypothetical protein [Carnobacterium maltaromaticum]|jgi:hypothetical protein|uniref:Uncharacterized protein n=1 Tax=Carnobacterium maltaromaticum LMA28 TaxID=1234679 RepID=K8E3D9_CARML|nr:hypothetical protein [Carnobacterium maltaromaticum]CCO10684.2 hypothetical protein BN424_1242 [Carnobacterium maltaromaticum LMA28]
MIKVEIIRGNGFAIVKKNDEYTIDWLQGPFDQEVSYPIQTLREDGDYIY